jgi:hypothetical protein
MISCMARATVLNSMHHCTEMRFPGIPQVGMLELDLSVMYQTITTTLMLNHHLVVVEG